MAAILTELDNNDLVNCLAEGLMERAQKLFRAHGSTNFNHNHTADGEFVDWIGNRVSGLYSRPMQGLDVQLLGIQCQPNQPDNPKECDFRLLPFSPNRLPFHFSICLKTQIGGPSELEIKNILHFQKERTEKTLLKEPAKPWDVRFFNYALMHSKPLPAPSI
jgi:hypothetical protein